MGEMDKYGDGKYVVPLGHYVNLCLGYGDYKGRSYYSDNPFHWSQVIHNLPDSVRYDPSMLLVHE